MISNKGIEKEEALGCVGNGWAPLIERFYETANQSTIPIVVLQVKEKFGGLRIYWNSEGENVNYFDGRYLEIDRLIDTLRILSTNTCETCGANGKIHMYNSWMKACCNACYEKWKVK